MKELNGKRENPISQEVTELYELMKTENLEELEMSDSKDFYLYIKRKGKDLPVAAVAAAPVVMPQAVQPVVIEKPKEEKPVVSDGLTVKSPIIGIFYRSPAPTSPAFVKEGDIVEAGKTLCIVEAMKVMNEIKSEFRLKVIKILVENGKPIIAGQELFQIEKA
jgi:acetyl-CoA carboxylase biotin carboxyl carrier protein